MPTGWPATWPGSTTRRAASGCRSSAWRWRCGRNYDPFQSPTHFKLTDLLKKFDKTFGATGKNYGKVGKDRTMDDIEKRRRDRWNFLFIAGMWFQDLFNYDFRRTEQCIIPYATQEGEISFCAYNTGVGWRNIIEKMHMTATLTKWYEEHGRHEIFAGGKSVPLTSKDHSLVLREEIVTNEVQHDLDRLGIAKTAREEKIRARDAKLKDAQEKERMMKLYRQHVLKEQPGPDLVQIGSIAPAAPRRSDAAGEAVRRRARRSRQLRRLVLVFPGVGLSGSRLPRLFPSRSPVDPPSITFDNAGFAGLCVSICWVIRSITTPDLMA